MERFEAVTTTEMMAAREARAATQQRLLKESGDDAVLIMLTLNVPGPQKVSVRLHQMFHIGLQRIRASLDGQDTPILRECFHNAKTGEVYFCVVKADPLKIKRQMAQLELQDALGRMLDIDVMTANGKVSREEIGLPPRRCLLCGNDARICGRSRAHSVEELMAYIHTIPLDKPMDRKEAETE